MLVLLINDIIQLNITSNNKIQGHFQLKETKTGNHGYPSILFGVYAKQKRDSNQETDEKGVSSTSVY